MIVQFIKFGIVGVVNTGIHYAVFYILYSIFGVYYLLASAIGYFFGLINSYVMNRCWTFNSKNSNKKKEFSKFVFVNIVSLGVNLFALEFFVVFGNLTPEVAQVFAILFSLAANFTGNKFWTFNAS